MRQLAVILTICAAATASSCSSRTTHAIMPHPAPSASPTSGTWLPLPDNWPKPGTRQCQRERGVQLCTTLIEVKGTCPVGLYCTPAIEPSPGKHDWPDGSATIFMEEHAVPRYYIAQPEIRCVS